ncbi:MAG: amino acid adenylation domain-containing protein, partial [Dinghuibacter sp.]|nr:amino acid adenylation domain-containing protein [Dinghuibacter sp.]
MKIDQYLTGLRKDKNIWVTVDNGNLLIRADEDVLTEDIIADIRSKKEEIVHFFHSVKPVAAGAEVERVADSPFYPLSSAQKRLYFIYELDKHSCLYNLTYTVLLEGTLHKQRLQEAFATLVQRHESLRTSFTLINNTPVQVIGQQVPFQVELLHAENETEAEELLQAFVRPFALNQAPLFRVGIVETGPNRNYMVVDMHHIIADGVSQAVLVKEFMALYAGETLPEPAFRYRDYACWQQGAQGHRQLQQQQNYWVQLFSGKTEKAELPADFPRADIRDTAGAACYFSINKEETQALQQLAVATGGTLYMVVLSVFALLVSKLGNHENVIIGTSAAGRRQAEFSGVVGMFVNMLALRFETDPSLTYSAWLAAVKKQCLLCFDNQEFPFEQLVEELHEERQANRNPLFDLVFDFQNFESRQLEIPGLVLKPRAPSGVVAKFDLTLTALEEKDGLRFTCEYATALFTQATIERVTRFFKHLVRVVVNNPQIPLGQVSLLTQEEAEQWLYTFNETTVPLPQVSSITELIYRQVTEKPDAIAIRCGEEELTYQQLDIWTNRLAAWLQQTHQIGRGSRVAVQLPRSIRLVPWMLAILKTGAAYIPVDTTYPEGRRHFIINDALVQLLVTDAVFLKETIPGFLAPAADELLAFQAAEHLQQPAPVSLSGSDAAYIMYTSGSTGQPKGVTIGNTALLNYCCWAAGYYFRNQPHTVFALYTSISFDLTVTSVYTPLITGNTIQVYEHDDKGMVIKEIIEDPRITMVKLTPSHLKIIRNLGVVRKQGAPELGMVVGGEQLDSALAAAVVQQLNGAVQVYNEYGPTETTVGCTIHRFTGSDVQYAGVPIGRPIQNTVIYLLDKQLKPVPDLVPGEMYVGGAGLTSGYFNREDLTRERVIANPFVPGTFMYKTGDRCVRLENGILLFKGRNDEQVKIRGFRIEPGEIENQVLQFPGIQEAVLVTAKESDRNFLIAYYRSENRIEPAAIRDYLKQHLPEYMVPAYFIPVTTWPLTPNGKLDKKALPGITESTGSESYVVPETEEELLLCGVWSAVLGRDRIGVRDNFFSVGGDSIKSIQIVSRIQQLGYSLNVNDIFTAQTVGELAKRLRRKQVESDQAPVTGRGVLTPIQRWLLEGPVQQKHHYNQSVLLYFKEGLSRPKAEAIFGKLQEHHDALRMVFVREGEQWYTESLPVTGMA